MKNAWNHCGRLGLQLGYCHFSPFIQHTVTITHKSMKNAIHCNVVSVFELRLDIGSRCVTWLRLCLVSDSWPKKKCEAPGCCRLQAVMEMHSFSYRWLNLVTSGMLSALGFQVLPAISCCHGHFQCHLPAPTSCTWDMMWLATQLTHVQKKTATPPHTARCNHYKVTIPSLNILSHTPPPSPSPEEWH